MEYIKDLSDTEMQEEAYDTMSLENMEPNQTRSLTNKLQGGVTITPTFWGFITPTF